MFKHWYMKYILGLDIGGTHIAGALADIDKGELLAESYHKSAVITSADSRSVLNAWSKNIKTIMKEIRPGDLAGIGIAMPGPFDYEKGISFIKGLGKYDALYGMNIREALQAELDLPADFPICFENDAACFALGEDWKGAASMYRRVVAITLGTGFGSAFLRDGEPQLEGKGVPPGGTLYQIPYGEATAEDHFSSRGLLHEYSRRRGERLQEVKTIYERALGGEAGALQVFRDFGKSLAEFLRPWLIDFGAECLVVGGGMSTAACFFMEDMKKEFAENKLEVKVIASVLGDEAAVLGAAGLFRDYDPKERKEISRKTNQFLLPVRKTEVSPESYDIYPSFNLKDGDIHEGIRSLAAYILTQGTVIVDGYGGVFWDELKEELRNTLPGNIKINIRDTAEWFLPADQVEALVNPYLGEDDSVWGKKCDRSLVDLFDKVKIESCRTDPEATVNVVWGVGAALCPWDAPVIYIDLPKNEWQYRMRARSITNLGNDTAEDAVKMYKRFYFVDQVLLNQHKKAILDDIAVVVDGQRPGAITWMDFDVLKKALQTMSKNVFRARPWFEPGAWGGQWMKQHITGINQAELNYAWSFELITPENGLVFESSHLLLEVSFDLLMGLFGENVLGKAHADRFGDYFPIRFDFLDTVAGGNLSIQCHPSVKYIQENFGEDITQDETYYILDAGEDAGVYLGFQENINPSEFRSVLEASNEKKLPVEITQFVRHFPSRKHDFFLIPNGTIHSAGTGNLVLEISATPYIFTFKMYDWLRLDLDGKPRPINIEHAFNNLDFERKGEKVEEELISTPSVVAAGDGWKQIHLPTHPAHFYDLHRYEFNKQVTIDTEESCHVLMLVAGSSVMVETKNGFKQRFHYAETFVIPAAAGSYTLTNESGVEAKVVKAFLKSGA